MLKKTSVHNLLFNLYLSTVHVVCVISITCCSCVVNYCLTVARQTPLMVWTLAWGQKKHLPAIFVLFLNEMCSYTALQRFTLGTSVGLWSTIGVISCLSVCFKNMWIRPPHWRRPTYIMLVYMITFSISNLSTLLVIML